MEETDACTGEHHEGADGKGRRRLVFRRLIKGGGFDEALGNEDQDSGEGKTENGRDEQSLENLDDLLPVETGGAAAEIQELVGEANPHDGADHGVRTGSREAEPPGSEVPDDGGNEKSEDHRKTCSGTDF